MTFTKSMQDLFEIDVHKNVVGNNKTKYTLEAVRICKQDALCTGFEMGHMERVI
jgi:hypothetical protein